MLSFHILKITIHVTQYSLLATSGSFCGDKNILNKQVAFLCDLQLNILLPLAEIQCPLGSGNYLDPSRIICALYHPCINHTERWTDNAFIGASAGKSKNVLFLSLTEPDQPKLSPVSFRSFHNHIEKHL
jgi:hypothetical protein